MQIIFLPDYSATSAYQTELASALAAQGHTVGYAGTGGLFALSKAALNNPRAGILHIHWMHALVPDGQGGMKVKFREFCLRLDIFLARKLLRKKLVWTVHNKLSHECRDAKAELSVRKLLCRQCGSIIMHCGQAKESLRDYYGLDEVKISVIPHGHFIGTYPNTVSRADARRRLGIAQDAFVYCCLGWIRPYKLVPEVIESFRRLNGGNNCLVVAGSPMNGDMERRVIEAANGMPNVKLFFGFIKPEDIQCYLNAADIMVLSYSRILNSGAAALAMSFSKPVIAPKMGCLPEMLGPRGAFFFNPDAPDGLFEAMKAAAAGDAAGLAEMGRRNFVRIAKCDWRSIARDTICAYQMAHARS